MKDLLLVENDKNLQIINKDFQFTVSANQFVAQKVLIRLKFFLGEYFLNINKGIPYRESIFIKNPNINLIEDLFVSEISSIDGVEELISFNLEVDSSTRELIVNFKVKTENGEQVAQELVVSF